MRLALTLRSISDYAILMRVDKPIGTLLLLWPTLWGLWLAADGLPSQTTLFVFLAGTFLMRSAGCVINDFADRHWDGGVTRTAQRPLACGRVSPTEALQLFTLLLAMAASLLLFLPWVAIQLAVCAAVFAIVYPFLKRITHLPQCMLGVAFSWGIPMAFVATRGFVGVDGWVLFAAAAVWPIMYDTLYAMADRDDDLKLGIKSTAILFGRCDKVVVLLLQCLFLGLLYSVRQHFGLGPFFDASLFGAALLFGYQQWLIRDRVPAKCFQAFLNNHKVGMLIFFGIFLDKLL